MAVHGQFAGDALGNASNHVQRALLQDSEEADLYFKLKYDRHQPDRVTISGLASGDYRSLNDLDVPEFVNSHLKAIPQELRDQLNSTQSIYTMGILPEIGRAYMTIDADLYVWNYEDSCDLAYFDGIPNTITKVGIAKPKAGVFQKHIHCLVVVATTKEILLLAANFISNKTVTCFSSEPEDFRHADMYLLPDALFKVPLDGNTISDIVSTSNGRIFFAEDENLFELDYQGKGWFSRKCRKLNHSKSFISYFLPSVSLITGREDRLVRLCIDDMRHILYGLSESGSIQVYDLRADGVSLVKVASVSQGQIQELAAMQCRSVDASFFADIVSINPVPYTQSRCLHLIATTRKGVRLFFTCFPPAPRNAYQCASKASVMKCMEDMRPSCLRLKHVRLPPGYGISGVSFHPLSIYNAFFSHEVGILAGEAGVEISSLSLFCSSNFPLCEHFTENVTELRFRGLIMTVARTIPSTQFLTALECRSSLDLPTFRGAHEKFIILCEKGIQMIDQRTPLDMLRDILHRYGSDSSQASNFIQLHGQVNVCDMALTILCSDGGANSTMKDSALRLFFMLCGEKIRSRLPAFQAEPMSEWSISTESLSDLSLNIRSPLYASTPQQQKRPVRSPSVSEMQPTLNVDEYSFSNGTSTFVPMTCRHDALYLHFSRIVGISWMKPLCQLLPDDQLVSVYCAGELEWLLNQLSSFKTVVELYGLIGNIQECVQPYLSGDDTPKSRTEVVSQAERCSLLNFRELLSLAVEVLSLWKILCEHQFHVITALLNLQTRQRLAATNFSTLVVNGHQHCGDLITCLVRHYLGDNATTAHLSDELRRCCPSLFSVEDANTTKATEMIEEARRMSSCPARTQMLVDAVKLLRAGVQKINLPMICQLLYEVDYVEGIVELALERAERDDSKLLALIAYKNHSGESDIFTQEAFARRREAYKCITDTLDRLMNDQKNLGTADLLNPSKDLIIRKVLESKDELANVAIFSWLLDNDFSNVVLQSKSPYLEAFLHRRVEEGGSSRYLDLLWRFHERNGDNKKAANLLFQLAQRETDAIDIQRRIAYLSQAAICVQSTGVHEKADSDVYELMLEIRDKLDVAQVQLATRDMMLSLPQSREAIAARNRLEKQLYTVQELFEEFAVPFNLPDIKLALCYCSSTYDETAVEDFYAEIIDGELLISEGEPRDVRVQRLGTRLACLAKKYLSVPKYYPLETILVKLLSVGMREGFAPSFLLIIATMVEAPLSITLDALTNTFRRDPFFMHNGTACRYLMRAALHVITKFAENPSSYSPLQSRIALASKCLDLIAGFLIYLSQVQSAVPDHKKLMETFRSLQTILESI